MVQFSNSRKQDDRLHELRTKEEEALAQMLAGKYKVPYVDLTKLSIDSDALRLLSEEESRGAEMAVFRKINKNKGMRLNML